MGWSDADVRAELSAAFGAELARQLDLERLARLAADLRSGRLGPDTNRVRGVPEPAGPADVERLDALAPAERERLAGLGRQALAAGRFAVCVLNGGMATRFGGDVKGVLEAVGGRSFLEIKRAQASARGPLPFLIMNSFATHERTAAFLRERGIDGVDAFLQGVSLRLTPEGELFREDDGRLSPHAPGHGDFPEALRGAGLVERLRARGVRDLMLSNVDNLGAEPDPLVIGFHLDRGRPLTAEVAATAPGDAGGAPVRLDGRLCILEGFRFPTGFDFARVPYLATNTFCMSLELLAAEHELPWYYVEKQVGERRAVQIEHLVNDLSALVPTSYLATPRSGPDGRFFPIKTRDDLAALQADPALVARFS